MTPKEALEILKNRIAGLALNHKIGSRDIANFEIKEIVKAVEIHVIPTLENLINEHEALKRDVARYFELKQGIPPLEDEMNYQFTKKYRFEYETPDDCYFRISNEFYRLEEKLSKVGKE